MLKIFLKIIFFIKTKLKTFPWGLPSAPIKIYGKSVKGFLSYDRISKQKITYLYI